jgi:large subunit ribosomal protein L13
VKTYSPKPRDIERRWYVIDAEGAVLGRLASEVAKILRGKHKPIFAPHADTGDHVIVVNARGIRLTGGKEEKKVYYRHSGYPGGISGITYGRLMAERPKVAVERAIKGMLPSNRLGRAMAKKLIVYDGPTHPHTAQRAQPLALGEIPKWEGLPKPKPAPVRAATPTAEKKRIGRGGTAKPAAAKASTAKPPPAKTAKAKTKTKTKTKTSSAASGRAARSRTAPARRTGAKAEAPAKDKKKEDTPAKKTGRSRRSKKTEES